MKDSALVWSSQYPKVPGLYFVRHKGDRDGKIVSLTGDPGNLKQDFCGHLTGLHNLPAKWGWEWAGPILKPKDPEHPGCRLGTVTWFKTSEIKPPKDETVLMWYLASGGYPAWSVVNKWIHQQLREPDFWAWINPPEGF